MTESNNKLASTRLDGFNLIAEGAIYGNLGLFVGAGLPKAIIKAAMSWPELIRVCLDDLEINPKKIKWKGSSYPDIASQVCKALMSKQKLSLDEASSILKEKISELTCFYPTAQRRNEYRKYIDDIDPSWIITTNYDLVLENILTGRAYPLAPSDDFGAPRGTIPIYHLHGIRTNPDSIVIHQEDYVELFRPNQYRTQKLPLLLKESVAVFVGYSLSDFNVLTAVDWSKNVFSGATRAAPGGLIQLLYSKNPKQKAYTRNNVLIIEYSRLNSILEELGEFVLLKRKRFLKDLAKFKKRDRSFSDPSDEDVESFVDEMIARRKILRSLRDRSYLISGFLGLLTKSIDLTWKRAEPPNAFYAYAQNLRILLDVLEIIDLKSMPPALMQTVAYNFSKVASFIGQRRGESYEAHNVWISRCNMLSKGAIKELKLIAKSHGYYHLNELLENINYKTSPIQIKRKNGN